MSRGWSMDPFRCSNLSRASDAACRRLIMRLDINHIGQIALPVTDVDRAEAFYRDALGLRQLYRFADLTFFDWAGVWRMLEKTDGPAGAPRSSVIYFRCADIAVAVRELRARGVTFDDTPHLIARM